MGKHSDMPSFKMRVDNMRLVPASARDQEIIGSYQNGAILDVTLWQGRNNALLRKYWAVLHRVVSDCPSPWESAEEASDALKMALGITDYGHAVNGKFFIRPGSISFTSMDEAKFQEFFEKAMAVLSRVTGVDVLTLGAEAADTGEDQQQDTPAVPPAADVEGGGAPHDDPASTLPLSADDAAAEEGENPGAVTTEQPAPSSAVLSADDRKSLAYLIKRLAASVGPDPEVVLATAKGVASENRPMSELASAKAKTITKQFLSACKGELDMGDAIEYACGIAGIDPKDVEGAE